jgi:hypothetical protein
MSRARRVAVVLSADGVTPFHGHHSTRRLSGGPHHDSILGMVRRGAPRRRSTICTGQER